MNFPLGDSVARVAGAPITLEEVTKRLDAIRRGPMGPWLPLWGPEDRRSKRWVLRMLVTEAIVSHHGGIALGDEADAAPGGLSPNGVGRDRSESLAAAARQLFELVTDSVEVSEHDARAYYRRNRDSYYQPERRLIRHRSEASLDRARLLAIDLPVRDKEWSRFELRRGEFSGPFEDAIFAAEIGEIVGPIESELGWHVAVVECVYESGYLAYEQVRRDIKSDLLSVARGRAFDGWLEQQRRSLSDVRPGWGHPGDPSLPDFSHRH